MLALFVLADAAKSFFEGQRAKSVDLVCDECGAACAPHQMFLRPCAVPKSFKGSSCGAKRGQLTMVECAARENNM